MASTAVDFAALRDSMIKSFRGIADRGGVQIWLLKAELAKAETVDDVAVAVAAAVKKTFGDDNVQVALMALAALGAIFVLWMCWTTYRLLFGGGSKPRGSNVTAKASKAAKSKDDKKHKNGKINNKKHSKSKPQDGEDDESSEAEAEPVPAASAPIAVVVKSARTRTPTVSECAPLKGLPMVGACAVSPDGMILVAASREKRIVRVYPMSTTLAHTAGMAKNFNAFTQIPADVVPSDAVITSVVFAAGSSAFALVDIVNFAVYTFRYSVNADTSVAETPKVSLTPGGRWALPKSAAKLGPSTQILSDDASTLFAMAEKDGVMEVYARTGGPLLGATKVKSGNSAAWAAGAASRVAAAGSYIHDTRIFNVTARVGGGSHAVALHQETDITTPKVSRLAMSADGTRLVMQLAGAAGAMRVYAIDVDLRMEEKPKLVAEWADADYADATHLSLAYYAARSETPKRTLTTVLAKGSDFVVYRIAGAQDAAKAAKPVRVAEAFDVHDGCAIRTIDVACRGAAVATSFDMDGRNIVRLWPVPPSE